MPNLLKGKPVVEKLRQEFQNLMRERKHSVTLAILLVGEDPASHFYKDHLVKLAQTLNVATKVVEMAKDSITEQVLEQIKALNIDEQVDGILPMMPLPAQIDTNQVTEALSPEKDIDCLNPLNAGLVYLGKSPWAPCTARAVMETLAYYEIALQGKRVVVLGRSNVVGKPLIPLLLAQNATVTVCHSKTVNLPQLTKEADILIVAVGVQEFVTPEMVRAGAVLIDVGMNETESGMVGDISAEANELSSAYTPVPGGIGTVSSMMVMQTLLCKNP